MDLGHLVINFGVIVTFLNGVLLLICFGNHQFFSLKWIRNLFLYSFLLTIFDLLLLKYFLTDYFKFDKELLTFFYKCGIVSNDFVSSISYLLKFIFVGLFFGEVFKNLKTSKIFHFLTILLISFELVMIFYFNSYKEYDSISSTVKNIFILSGSCILLFRINRYKFIDFSLFKNTYFWVGFAFFISTLSELFLEFIFQKLYTSDLEKFYNWYPIRNLSQIMFFLLMIVGFLNAKYLKYLPEKY